MLKAFFINSISPSAVHIHRSSDQKLILNYWIFFIQTMNLYFYLFWLLVLQMTKNFIEASLLDRIKMTKNRIEFDQKNLTMTNLNIGTWLKIHTDECKSSNLTEIWMNLTEKICFFLHFSHIHMLMFVNVVIFITIIFILTQHHLKTCHLM